MSGSTYRQYRQSLVPTTHQRPNGQAFQGLLGDVEDTLVDRAKQSVKARMPLLAPPDALTALGVERQIPQGAGESSAAYAARLQDAWNTWPWAGTPFGLLRAFYSTGYTNVVLAQVRGGNLFTLDNGGTNLLTWSGDISNAAWTKTNVTVTRNNSAAPDGTTTAALLHGTANAGFVEQQGVASATVVQYAASCYLKLSGGAHSAELVIWDATAGSALATSGLIALTSGFVRFSASGLGVAGHVLRLRIYPAGNQAVTGDCFAAYPQFEVATAPTPYVQTSAANVPTSIGAGNLVTTAEGNGIWETDALSFPYSPLNQTLWSKFDVLFPLPLNPSNFSWSGGIPSSSSTESNFIRALIQAWKPGHATCNRIVIVTAGRVLGYPIRTLGAGNGTLGGNTTVVWTP